MDVGVVAKVRNGALLKFREDFGLTQSDAAEAAGVNTGDWNAVECLRFDTVSWLKIEKLAEFLGVLPVDLCPPGLKDTRLKLERTMYRNVQSDRLLAVQTQARLTLPSPADVVERSVMQEELHREVERVLHTLSPRHRNVLSKLYGLLGQEAKKVGEVAHDLGCSVTQVRHLEHMALKKIREKPVRCRSLLEHAEADVPEWYAEPRHHKGVVTGSPVKYDGEWWRQQGQRYGVGEDHFRQQFAQEEDYQEFCERGQPERVIDVEAQ